MPYQPPYTITSTIVSLIAEISENLGQLSVLQEQENKLYLRRINRIRTIQGSLANEQSRVNEKLTSKRQQIIPKTLPTTCSICGTY